MLLLEQNGFERYIPAAMLEISQCMRLRVCIIWANSRNHSHCVTHPLRRRSVNHAISCSSPLCVLNVDHYDQPFWQRAQAGPTTVRRIAYCADIKDKPSESFAFLLLVQQLSSCQLACVTPMYSLHPLVDLTIIISQVSCLVTYSRVKQSLTTFLFGQWDHSVAQTPLSLRFKNTLIYLLTYLLTYICLFNL